MVFAVFTFFLVMKRINLVAIYLYSSALLAFAAAILDLAQILAGGSSNTDNGLDPNTVAGLTNTREVGFALSFGFRYLFLWKFVAQRPPGEPRSPQSPPDSQGIVPEDSSHSSSWERWGVLGVLLKWGLLASVISIPILQIVWRIATRFGPVYIAESTVEIVVSALFIIKLLLNVFLSLISPRWRPLRSYLFPIIALLLSLSVGAGNVIFFLFSETTLGRFLQAVELYILILYVLIVAFYVPRSTATPRRNRTSSFAGVTEKPRESQFQVPPEDDGEVMIIGRAVTSSDEGSRGSRRQPSRESTVSRISSWVITKVSRRPQSGEQQLWNVGDAELGIASEVQQTTTSGSAKEKAPALEEARETPVTTAVASNSQAMTPASVPPINTQVTVNQGLSTSTPLANERPETGGSFASYYAMQTDPRMSYVPFARNDLRQGSDSPVYGLDGIMNRTPKIRDPSPLLRPPSTYSRPVTLDSFDELLRQQTELDKSIAALRLFSPQTSTFPTPAIPEPVTFSKTSATERQSMSTNSRKGDSVSNRSEFSLSIFPDPPARETFPASPLLGRQPTEVASSRFLSSKFPEDANAQPSTSRRPPARFESATSGTQYDVTSFIGDLTSPVIDLDLGEGAAGDDPERSDSPILTPTATSAQSLRPLLLGSSKPARTSFPPLGPATSSSSLLPPAMISNSPPQVVVPEYEYPTLKPFLLGTPSAAASPAPLMVRKLSTTENTTLVGPRRPVRGSSKRTKVNISGPRLAPQDGKGEDAPGAFERPRPPPLVIPQQDTSVAVADDVKGKGREEQRRF